MREHDDRAARQAADLARHLNDRPPGTILLLARYAPAAGPTRPTRS